jgi:hypothetical protein
MPNTNPNTNPEAIVAAVKAGTMSKSQAIRALMDGTRSQYAVSKILGVRPQFVSNVCAAVRMKANKANTANTAVTVAAAE